MALKAQMKATHFQIKHQSVFEKLKSSSTKKLFFLTISLTVLFWFLTVFFSTHLNQLPFHEFIFLFFSMPGWISFFMSVYFAYKVFSRMSKILAIIVCVLILLYIAFISITIFISSTLFYGRFNFISGITDVFIFLPLGITATFSSFF